MRTSRMSDQTNAQQIEQAGAAIESQIKGVQARIAQENMQLAAAPKSGQDRTPEYDLFG